MEPDDPELRRVFLEEARRRVREMATALRGRAGRDKLWRHAHSLTGAASSVGEEGVERLARDIAEAVRDETGRPRAWTREARVRVERDVAGIEDELGRLH
ncbi:MAG TPA: Hpt domain-containing protein [Candidatus Thermoplasmatota archaeon]|nr:Hpt domain-containing protein [Candidatus Thermoplasmatota archaeon]